MVAYSFKSGFIPEINALIKRQTIRLPRKRHARAGEKLQFFTGPRMAPIRIGEAKCVACRDVRLDFKADRIELDEFEVIEGEDALNAFAIRDGFRLPDRLSDRGGSSWEYMARWWSLTHPGQALFRGVLIDWDDTFTMARASA